MRYQHCYSVRQQHIRIATHALTKRMQAKPECKAHHQQSSITRASTLGDCFQNIMLGNDTHSTPAVRDKYSGVVAVD